MYTLMLQKSFAASHFLIGGDWGAENEIHAHPYRVEIRLSAKKLDQHGYLVDLDELEKHLEDCLSHYQGKTLNNLPEFIGKNPSIERFAKIFFETLRAKIEGHGFAAMEIRIWENENAWASYQEEY